MENSILENLLLPWWKILLYLFAAVVAVFTIKVSLTFNLNTWLQDRKKAKEVEELKKIASECGHVWTLYPGSVYSRCNLCLAFIATSTLVYAKEHFDKRPLFAGVHHGVHIVPPKPSIMVTDYIGKRK